MQRYRSFQLSLLSIVFVGCGPEPPIALNDSSQAPPDNVVKSAASSPSPTTAEPVRRSPEDLPQPTKLTAEDWPQYRGTHRDGISQAKALTKSWPPEGPPVIWKTTVAQGYAAPSVVAGKVYLNDYEEEQGEWSVRCLKLDTGDELWRYKVEKRIRPNHAITRSAPATDGGFLFAIDPKCELHCLDARDGSLIWKKFLPAEYETQIPPWYNGQCPLVDGDRLVIATGGRVLMTALNKAAGEAIWETENSGGFLLTHSSIMPVEIEGVKQYTYTTLKGLVGVEAVSGELLWHFPWKFNTAVTTTPLPLGDGKFLLTSGYHARTVVCQVKQEGNQWTTEEVTSLAPPPQGWNSEVHTPIVYRDHIFGVGKKQRGLWTCLDLEGNEVWTSAGKASFGLGGYLLADGMFFVLEGKTGTLRILDADADQYQEIGKVQLLQGPDVWAPPIISQGKLLIRDLGQLVCLDITANELRVAASDNP